MNTSWFWESMETMDDAFGKHVSEKTQARMNASHSPKKPGKPIGRSR